MHAFLPLLLSAGSLFAGVTYTLSFQPSEFTVSHTPQGWIRISHPDAAINTRSGEPALPSVGVNLLLPPGTEADQVEIQSLEFAFLAKGIPEPTQTETYIGGPAVPTAAPKPEIYHGTHPFPSQVVELITTGNLGGYRIAVLQVNPVRFDPVSGTVEVATHLTFTVHTRPARKPGMVPRQAVAGVRHVLDTFVAHLVDNPEALATYRPHIPEVPLSQVHLAQPHARQLDRGPYAYLIVTDTAFVPALQPLADFHTAWGLPTAIYTVDWILSHYSGRNSADQIRNFLREAYQTWGIQYVLLAGDADFVPYQTIYHPLPHGNYTDWTPPSDWFYANLDGNWNRDGDDLIGEWADSVDMFPELLVGRVPLNTPEQAERFVWKVLVHSTMPGGDSLFMNTEYLNHVILAASYLDRSNGWGYKVAERVAEAIPTWLERRRVYETETHQTTVEEFVNAVNQGASLMFVEAHGSYPFFAVNKEPYIPFGIPEIQLLANRYQWPILQLATCHSGGWDKTSILEYLLVGTENGIVGGIATVRLDYPYSDLFMNQLFFRAFFESPAPVLGLGLFYLTKHLWAVSGNTTKRYIYLSKTLLGDPALPVWVGAPRTLAVSIPASLRIGWDTLEIQVRNADNQEPLPQAAVVLWQPGGNLYQRVYTDAQGWARIPLYLSTADSVRITVTANGFVPVLRRIPVEAQGAVLHWVGVDYDDHGYGDGDGIPEAAESVQVHLRFTLLGTEPLAGATVRLVPLHPYALLPVDSVSVGPVFSGDTVEAVFPLYLVPETPDAQYLKFAVVVDPASVRTDTLTPEVGPCDTLKMWVQAARPRIVRIYRKISGDTLFLWPEIVNLGHDDARNLWIRVQAASTFTEVLDTMYFLGFLPAQALHFDTLFHAPVRVRKLHTNLFWIRENWTLHEERGRGDTTLLHANRDVSPPANVRVDPHPEGVRVHWSSVYLARGYLVFRLNDQRGTWERLTFNLWPHAEYIDPQVSFGETARYRIVTVDQYWNASVPSYEATGTTQPPLLPGWPVTYEGGGESHHPVVADFDPSYPGLEILFGTSTGKVYAFHADGTPVSGWPVDLDPPAQVWNSVALGDLDQDGQLELVVAPRMIDRVYAFEVDGSPVSGWPVDFTGGGTPGQEVSRMGAYASPVVYDLDQDGQPEVLIHGMSGKVWCWHGDGTPYLSGSDGLFANLGAYNWDAGGLAVGDVDGDGQPEVVVTSVSSSGFLWALEPDGTPMPGFPLVHHPSYTEYSQSSVALGDFNRYRPGLEIAFVWSRKVDDLTTYHYVGTVDASGQFLPNLYTRSINVSGSIYTLPTLADINNDDQLELLVTTKEEILALDTLGNNIGDMLFQFAQLQNFAQPVLADITGENVNEVFGIHGDGYIYAWSEGQVVSGFPIFVNNEIKTTPVVADVDQDGGAELVVLGLERVYVFDLTGSLGPSDYAWPMAQHDIYHTGNAEENPWWRHSPKGIQASVTMPSLQWGLAAPLPNPTPGPITLAVTVAEPARFALEVYDVTGRRVRTLFQGALSPGVHSLAWDLTDASGHRVTPGLYFLHLRAPEIRRTQRVLVLP